MTMHLETWSAGNRESTAGSVDILLATFNGERYLDELLRSIERQRDNNWRLLVRDDGSGDRTMEILRCFASRHPEKVEIIEDGCARLGIIANFSTLMARSDADYAMFCDQDDVWLPDKIGKSRAAIKALEARHGRDRPLLVHTDLHVVDKDLGEIARSFLRHQILDPVNGRALNRILVQNIAPGCSIMFNRPLREIAAPIPAEAIMHDWWLMLTAAAFGVIEHLPEALVLYRQHGTNTLGAKERGIGAMFLQFVAAPKATWHYCGDMWVRTQRQAAAFMAVHGSRMSPEMHRMISCFATLSERNHLTRRLDLLRCGFRANSRAVSLLLFAFV